MFHLDHAFQKSITFVDNAENLDIVMPMYNLLEYSDNFSKTSGNLWNYYRDEVNDSANENNDVNSYRINNNKTVTSKFFKYKTKIVGNTRDNNNRLNAEVVAPLKYLSNFWRSRDLPLIYCEIELDLSWSRYCGISEILRRPAVPAIPNANPPVPVAAETETASTTFQVNIRLYVPVVTLTINDNTEFLENIKKGFKRTISWNKYRFEITTQPKNNNLDYLIDPTFRNINKLFALSFINSDNDPTRNSFNKYYMPLVEIKRF